MAVKTRHRLDVPYYDASCEINPTGACEFHRIDSGMYIEGDWQCIWCGRKKYYPVSFADAVAYQTMLHKMGYDNTQALMFRPGRRKLIDAFRVPVTEIERIDKWEKGIGL